MSPENRFQYIHSKKLSHLTVLDATMSDFSYAKHAHEEYSLGVTLKGRQDFFCQHAFHQSPAGGILLFNPEDVHDGHSGITENLEYVMLYIHPDVLQPLFHALGYHKKSLLRFSYPLLNNPILRYQILALRNMFRFPHYSKIEFETALFQIAHSLVKSAGYLENGLKHMTKRDVLMLRAKDYILSNLAQDISVDDIAHTVNMSKFHFIRLFRCQFGITPHQYVLNCRINLARKNLEAGFSPSHVALESGFADSSHLNRYFKRVFGMTPKQYQLQRVR
ncbi:AraC family transcriptional regulator [Vibrio sp. PP-XX7]